MARPPRQPIIIDLDDPIARNVAALTRHSTMDDLERRSLQAKEEAKQQIEALRLDYAKACMILALRRPRLTPQQITQSKKALRSARRTMMIGEKLHEVAHKVSTLLDPK